MTNLYEPTVAAAIQDRVSRLRPDNPRAWGKMNAAQMLAHCSAAMEMAVGDTRPKRMMIGRLIGRTVLRKVTGDEAPLGKNSPTAKELVIADTREFSYEQRHLRTLVERFTSAGPVGCTTTPHPFFGDMTADQWSTLMYKHLDHHLRQFNA